MNRLQKLKIKLFHDKHKDQLKSYPGIFDMYDKEQEIFFKSIAALGKLQNSLSLEKNGNLKNNLLYAIHGYEALMELFTNHQKDFWFDDDTVMTLNFSVEEITIALKHIMSGYYESAHVHLRMVMESIIKLCFKKLVNKEEIQAFRKHKKEEHWNEHISIEDKISLSLKHGDFYKKEIYLGLWGTIENKDFFDEKNIWKYTNNYVRLFINERKIKNSYLMKNKWFQV